MASAVGAAAMAAATFGCAAAYAGHGRYLDYARQPLGSYFVGPDGVPQVRKPWGAVDHPVLVETWALLHWSHGQRRPLLKAANWLVSHQRRDGGFAYPFYFDAAGVTMLAPWISAMAQGMADSVLVRAYHSTHRRGYLRAARRALLPFLHGVRAGGVTTRWGGYRWYEEYPGQHSQHVLNGFEFALVGLHDMASYSPRARLLWRRGVRALAAHIASFDVPVAHTQLYAYVDSGRISVGPAYRHAHAVLTREIARLTSHRLLWIYADRWATYERERYARLLGPPDHGRPTHTTVRHAPTARSGASGAAP